MKTLESIFRNWVDHYQEIFGTETLLKRVIYLKLFLFPKLCYSRLTFASSRVLTQVIPGGIKHLMCNLNGSDG